MSLTKGAKQPYIPPELGRDILVADSLADDSVPFIEFSLHGMDFKAVGDAYCADERATKLALILLREVFPLQLQQLQTGNVLCLDDHTSLAGVTALRLGYKHVTFTNVSSAVLSNLVWPNVMLNCPSRIADARCVASANWIALSEYLITPGEHK